MSETPGKTAGTELDAKVRDWLEGSATKWLQVVDGLPEYGLPGSSREVPCLDIDLDTVIWVGRLFEANDDRTVATELGVDNPLVIQLADGGEA